MSQKENSDLAAFDESEIRKAFHEGEWWFSVIDVIDVLVGSDSPRKYWSDLKKKLIAEGYFEVSEKIGQLKMFAWGIRTMKTLTEVKTRLLKDKATRAAYIALEDEFATAHQLILPSVLKPR